MPSTARYRTWTSAPASTCAAIRPPQPSTSSSACGEITSTRSKRRIHCPPVLAGAVVLGGTQDQLVERDPGPPAQVGRRPPRRDLVERLGLGVVRPVHAPAVDADDRRRAA